MISGTGSHDGEEFNGPLPTPDMVFLTQCHPEASQRTAQSGEQQWEMSFTLEDKRVLMLKMGKLSFDSFRAMLRQMDADDATEELLNRAGLGESPQPVPVEEAVRMLLIPMGPHEKRHLIWPEDVLRQMAEDKAIPAGTKIWNPDKNHTDAIRPERDVRGLVAVTKEDAVYVQQGAHGPGLYAQCWATPVYQASFAARSRDLGMGFDVISNGMSELRVVTIVNRVDRLELFHAIPREE